jgi:ubiquinone/menaquinone biosynthesis C-methylase UbiE
MNERTYHGGAERLRLPGRLQLLEIDRVVALSLEGISAGTMLDVGTGSGVWAEAFVREGLCATGIDTSEEMVAEAKKFVPSGVFGIGSAETLSFSNDSFDIVFLGHILHEADSVVQMLSEAVRVASHRVMVLEWPYKEQEQGPPLAHRLKPEVVVSAIESIGSCTVETIFLSTMVLYRITKSTVNS